MSTATLQEPISVVADDDHYEVVDGQRVRTPPMGVFGVWVASRISRFLGNFADGTQGWVLTEALFHLPAPINRDRRPDVAFVSFDRWAKSRPMPPIDNAWDVVPNLVTEVISPTDIVEDLDDKIAEYFRAGVQVVWVVYPTKSKIHIYSSPTQIAVLTKVDVLDGGTVVPGFRLALAELNEAGRIQSLNGSPSKPQTNQPNRQDQVDAGSTKTIADAPLIVGKPAYKHLCPCGYPATGDYCPDCQAALDCAHDDR